MRWSDIPMQPPRRTLRSFAVTGLLLFSGLACWQHFQDRHVLAAVFGSMALVLGTLGLVYPAPLRLVFVGMLIVTFPLSWLVSHLVLAVAYYCLFTPVALVFKLIGRDVLDRRWQPMQETYWTAKPQADNVRDYFRPS